MNVWLGLRRPLLLAFFIGCTVSFLTAGTLTLRLLAPGMIFWSFVPIVEVAALAAVCWKDRHNVPFSNLVDSFFSGYRSWFLWLAGMSVIWTLTSPSAKPLDWTVSVVWLDGGVVIALVWSLFVDFHFFRLVLKRSPARARRQLLIQRLISWGLILAVLGAPTIWSEITGRIW
jgi:hypothetical protein